jgi:opacity protein-like surface antigen
MTRSVRSAIVRAIALFTVVVFMRTGVARAQTAPPPPVPPHRIALEVTTAATLGHTSHGSFGAEADYAYTPQIDFFVEGAHIGNAATKDLDNRARALGNAVGATVSAVERVNFIDFGARYHVSRYVPPKIQKIHPYVAGGLGFANVKTATRFSINGTAVVPDSLGIQLGSDLAGTHNRAFLMLGFGGTMPFHQRYFLDFGYRYGHAFGQTDQGELVLAGVNTNRIQIGAGIYF